MPGFLNDIMFGLPANVISGLAGAFLVWLLFVTVNYVKAQQQQKRFPIQGRYLSRYEDIVDGKKVIQKAPVTLTQKGLQLVGTTTNFSQQRTWKFQMTIEQSRFIHGVYWPEDSRDKSYGVIFLEIQLDGSLQGIWAGYAPKIQQVYCGKYWFIRAVDFEITSLGKDDHRTTQAWDSLRSELGERYISRDQFETYLRADPKQSHKVVLVAQHKATQKVLGVLLAEIVDEQALRLSFLGSYDLAVKNPEVYRLRNQTTALIKSIVVDEPFRGNGIGTELMKHAIQLLEKKGAKGFYTFAWISKQNGCQMQGMLESLGFKSVLRFDEFWLDNSTQHHYDCPVCGHPCHCAVLLFVRK
jgi:ribosomal protein S18 acetylase RimI-like enzyme